MLSTKDINKLSAQALLNMSKLETDLLAMIARRFSLYESIGGDLEYKLKQLSRLGMLDNEAIEIIAKSSGLTFKYVETAIADAGIQAIDYKTYRKAFELGATSKNIADVAFTEVVSRLYATVSKEIALVYHEISKNVPRAYKQVIDTINLETVTGVLDYDSALRKSLTELADKGITAMTYERRITDKDGNRISIPVNQSIESVARRTIVSAIVRSGNAHNEKVADELGAEWYATSQHMGARNKGFGHENHESWQGIHFQIANNEFAKMTGEGLVDGLGGANCRHIKFAYFPNISPEHVKTVDTAENAYIYDLEQKQRGYEREIRKAKKQLVMAEALGDNKYIEVSKKKLKSKQSTIRKFIKDNEWLRRDYAREMIQ